MNQLVVKQVRTQVCPTRAVDSLLGQVISKCSVGTGLESKVVGFCPVLCFTIAELALGSKQSPMDLSLSLLLEMDLRLQV